MIIFIFLRKSAWKFLQRQGLVSSLYTKVLSWPKPNFQESLLPVSEQDPLHRLIELFFTDTGKKSASQCQLNTKSQVNLTPQGAPGTKAWRCLDNLTEHPLLQAKEGVEGEQLGQSLCKVEGEQLGQVESVFKEEGAKQ